MNKIVKITTEPQTPEQKQKGKITYTVLTNRWISIEGESRWLDLDPRDLKAELQSELAKANLNR